MCLNIVSDSIRLDLFVLNNNKLQNPTLVSIRAHWAFCVKRTCMWCRVPPPSPSPPCNFCSSAFFSTISPFARWMGRGRSWLHFVTEEGTLVNETGTLKQTSCKWDQPFPSVRDGEVELLRWFRSGFDNKLPKKKRGDECRSLQEKPGRSTHTKKSKSIHVTECTWI